MSTPRLATHAYAASKANAAHAHAQSDITGLAATLALLAPLNSPNFTDAESDTPAPGNNTTRVATTAFTTNAVATGKSEAIAASLGLIATALAWSEANTTLPAGRIGVESDTLRFKIGNGSSTWAELAYAGELFDGVFTEAAAPATPSSGKVVLYAKTDGLLYSKDDAGVETQVSGGAGGGSGGETWDAAFDGLGYVVVTGSMSFRPVASTGTIAKAALVGDVSGSVTVTVKKYTPSGGALASEVTLGTIALASVRHNSSTPSWSVTAGDVLEFSLGGTITSVTKVFVRLST